MVLIPGEQGGEEWPSQIIGKAHAHSYFHDGMGNLDI